MYTLFDSISAKHDVYKVETIGDAYMTVSGLPLRNGDKHAGEICTTALHLITAVRTFKVPHMPDTRLRLRSGVNTGNMVAGAVGLKIPCLFGESASVASEMESGGKSSQIQVSSKTKKNLQRFTGYLRVFLIYCRSKATYWLNGEDGLDIAMPIIDKDEK